MTARTSAAAVAVSTFVAALVVGAGAQQAPVASHPSERRQPTIAAREVLDKYCVTCHNSRAKTADLLLDSLDPDNVGPHAEQWEKVASKLRTHEMPPAGRPRPDWATYDAMATL